MGTSSDETTNNIANAEVKGVITALSGTVFIVNKDTGAWRVAKIGDKVLNNDAIYAPSVNHLSCHIQPVCKKSLHYWMKYTD